MEEGRRILYDHYGGDQSANFIDYYLRKVELYVNILLDNKKVDQSTDTDASLDMETVKRELAEANEAFINLAKKVNVENSKAEAAQSAGATNSN